MAVLMEYMNIPVGLLLFQSAYCGELFDCVCVFSDVWASFAAE